MSSTRGADKREEEEEEEPSVEEQERTTLLANAGEEFFKMEAGGREKGGEELAVATTYEEDMTSPLRCVKDVLMEAEDIFAEASSGQEAAWNRAGKRDETVLVDQVDLQYSPQKGTSQRQLPIEIVVRHNKVISHSGADSDSDDGEGRGGSSSRRHPFATIQEDVASGGGGGGQQGAIVDPTKTAAAPFRKGHRRAWSMPSHVRKGEHMQLAVIHDDKQMEDGMHRRRIVRYRCHPSRGHRELAALPGATTAETIKFEEVFGFPGEPDDDNELEVEINEEEIVYPESGGRGRRTVVKRFWEARWKAQNFELLPEWLQDNEFLRTGHRPPLPSFATCFKSIFALHSETGNIWTHMYGCVFFLGVAAWLLFQPPTVVPWTDKIVFIAFFIGSICCMGLSFCFHTVQCHSQGVGRLFSKLDYTGISMMIVGSFVPWIYYGFYCRPQPMIIYLTMITVLGTAAIVVSLWDKFGEPKFRPVRAGVFVLMGISSIVPGVHLIATDGLSVMFGQNSFHWLIIMGAFYLVGALVYATRIPERFFPGKCDLWFQSHQLFHTFVVIAAMIHLHGISYQAVTHLEMGSCPEQLLEKFGSEVNTNVPLTTWVGLEEPADVVSWNPSMTYP